MPAGLVKWYHASLWASLFKSEASRVRFSHSARDTNTFFLFYKKVNLIIGHLEAISANVFSIPTGTCTELPLVVVLEA